MDININRILHIGFPDAVNQNLHDITTGIEENSVSLSEVLISEDNVIFGSYNSTKFEVIIYGIPDVSSERIEVYFEDGSSSATTSIFTGYVDSSKLDNLGYYRQIVAYDDMYWKRDVDVTAWWKDFRDLHPNGSYIREVRNSLCDFVGLSYNTDTMFNDNFLIKLPPVTDSESRVSFSTMLSQLCELQCTIPHFTREGDIKFIDLTNVTTHDVRNAYEQANTEFEDYEVEEITKVSVFINNTLIATTDTAHRNIYKISDNIFLNEYWNRWKRFKSGSSERAQEKATATEQLNQFVSSYRYHIRGFSYIPTTVTMICSDFDIQVGDALLTDRGRTLVFTNELSGLLLVEQTTTASGNKRYGDVTSGPDMAYSNMSEQVSNLSTTLQNDYFTSEYIQTNYLDANTVEADYVKTENLEASVASLGYVHINDLDADVARVGYLKTENLDAANANLGYVNVSNLDVAVANAGYLKTSNLDAEVATLGYAKANTIEANYAHIDLANVNNAWIQNGVIKNAAITNEMVASVSANKLTAGTIDASNIQVTNLNASEIKTGRLTVDGITIDVTANEASIDGGYIEDGTITLSGLSREVTDKIDGAIETFTGTVIPTLNNYPASSWTTSDIKATHVGDVYYVVNESSTADGYCYRFTYDNSTTTYKWILIKDSDVTKALQDLIDAQGDISELQTFESTTTSWITNTDEELGSLKQRTTTLETEMGTKVSTTTFNEVKQTVDANSSSITTLSESKADKDDVTLLTNRVSNIEQTSSEISLSVSELNSSALNNNILRNASTMPINDTGYWADGMWQVQNAEVSIVNATGTPPIANIKTLIKINRPNITSAIAGIAVVGKTIVGRIASTATPTIKQCNYTIPTERVDSTLVISGWFKGTQGDRFTLTAITGQSETFTLDTNDWEFKYFVTEEIQTPSVVSVIGQISLDSVASSLYVCAFKLEYGSYPSSWDVLTDTVSYQSAQLTIQSNSISTLVTEVFPDGTQSKSSIEQNSDQISTIVSEVFPDGTSSKSAIEQNADNIELKVSKDGVISSINQSAEAVTINASRVNLQGAVTISSFDSGVKSALTKSVTSKNQYYLSNSNQSLSGGSWVDSPASLTWSSGKYIWTRIQTTFTFIDDTTSTVNSTAVYDKQLTSSLSKSTSAETAASSAESKADGNIKSTVSWYYRSTDSSYTNPASTSTPSTSDDVDNTWTLVLPKPKNNANRTYHFFTCERYVYGNDTTGFSDVREMSLLSATNAWCKTNDVTHIDGGMLATTSVIADKIDVSTFVNIGDTSSQHIHLDSSAVEIKNGNTVLASYGSTTTIGSTSSRHLKISSSGFEVKNGSNLMFSTQSDGNSGRLDIYASNRMSTSPICTLVSSLDYSEYSYRTNLTAWGSTTDTSSTGRPVLQLNTQVGTTLCAGILIGSGTHVGDVTVNFGKSENGAGFSVCPLGTTTKAFYVGFKSDSTTRYECSSDAINDRTISGTSSAVVINTTNAVIGKTGSSARWKNSIRRLVNGENADLKSSIIDSIMSLPVAVFKYNAEDFIDDDVDFDQDYLGLIAEDVRDFIPMAAVRDSRDPNEVENWDARIILPATLLLAQETYSKIKELEEQLLKLKGE